MHGYWKSQSWGKGVLGRKIDNIFRDTVGESIEITIQSYYSLVANAALYYKHISNYFVAVQSYTSACDAHFSLNLMVSDFKTLPKSSNLRSSCGTME